MEIRATEDGAARLHRSPLLRIGAGVVLVLLALGSLDAMGRSAWGRRVFASMGVGCPFGSSDPLAVSRGHARAMAALAGNRPAPATPALGLLLGKTTETDARRWAEGAGLNCGSSSKGFRFLTCKNVPASAVGEPAASGAIGELVLAFAPRGTLVGVDATRMLGEGPAAKEVYAGLALRLRTSLGEPAERVGDELQTFGGADHPMATSFVHYRFQNYVASLTAMNMPWRHGIAVREQFTAAGQAL